MTRIVMMVAVFLLVACSDKEADTQTSTPATEVSGTPLSDHGIVLLAPDMAAADLYIEVISQADMGDVIDANQLARELVENAPDWSGAWTALANTALSGEQFAKASKKASELSGNGTLGEQLWAEVNMGFLTNDTEASIEAGKKLLTTYPESARAALLLSGLYTAQNQINEAREAGEKAISIEDKWLPPLTNLGFSYLFNDPKDFQEAEAYFSKAISIAPEADNLRVYLGDVHSAAGKLDQAALSYSQALEIDPANALAAVKRAHINSFLGQYDAARADYDLGIAASKEGNQATLPVYRAFIHLHAGDPEKAVEELHHILSQIKNLDMPLDQKTGSRIFVLTNIANICFHNEMNICSIDSVSSLRESLTITGTNSGDADFARRQEATAIYWEGKLSARNAVYELAREKAETFKTLLDADSNPRKLEPYHELLGLTALLAKDYDQSIEHYRQSNLSLSTGGGDVKNSYMLATALNASGYHEEARELLARIANWNFNSVWFAMLRKTAAQEAK